MKSHDEKCKNEYQFVKLFEQIKEMYILKFTEGVFLMCM